MTSNIDPDLEKVFQTTWTKVELRYARWILIQGQQFLIPLYRTLHIWSQLKYCTKLRAGTSMDSLILSRSREHGLRRDQHALQIYVENATTFKVRHSNGEESQTIQVNSTGADFVIAVELDQLIKELVTHPID